MSRGILRAAGAAALVAAALATASTAGATQRPPALDWRPCDDGMQCATAEVPRDYAHPHGPTLELALVRRPATDREHRIGSLFMNPGGPGSSGIEFVRTMPPIAQQIVGRRFDVVGFDPRGVGESEPAVDCADAPPLTGPLRLVTPETLDVPALLRNARDKVRRCLTGPHREIAPYLTTANVARDLDLLRAAVGDDQLTYLGLSYGGLIGETYTTLFPGRTRAMVLDSPVDGDVWLNRPLQRLREQLAGFETELHRFAATCAAHQDACGFGGDDPEAAFDALLERLDREPLAVPSGPPVSGDEVRDFVASALYSKFNWPLIASALGRLRDGDGTVLRPGGGAPFGSALDEPFTVYDSVEARYPNAIAPYLEFGEDSSALSEHFAIGTYEKVDRGLWPVGPRGAFYGPYRHAASATPVLVLASTHDPAAPYRWAKRVVADLGNARLVGVHGDGHGVLTQLNGCALGIFLAFVEETALPPAGTSCDQDVPFVSPAAASARRSRAPSWGVPSTGLTAR